MSGKGSTLRGTINRVLLKAKYALYCTMLFFLFANPYTYKVTNNYLGGNFIDSGGEPTPLGLGVHTFLFFITLSGLMLSPV